MKNLTNILSYLWLLLLMAVTACSDMEREVDEMQQQLQDADQVELTIHTQVPRMKAGTRAVNADNLTSVTALAFDKDDMLIKVVSPTEITQDNDKKGGSFKVKVPLRTRSVHFLGNYTLNSGYAIGKTTASALLTPLKTIDTNNLYYWGMVTFADATALKNYSDKVNLYRDKALITLNSTIGQSDYIAGLLHYYPSGALVPSGNVVGTATIPNEVDPKSHGAGNNLGTETYVYEHANNTNETHLYAICCIDGLFYKIAFATNNNGELNHFPIVRNHQYNININEIETALGSNRYEDAVAANPINNAVVTEVELSVTATPSAELYFNNESTVTVTATVPVGVSALAITAPEFDVTTTSDKVTKTSDYNYTVNSAGDVEFTFTLKDGSYTDGQTVSILFTGTAEYGYELTNPEAISITLKAQKAVSIEAEPSAMTLNYAESSVEDLLVNVTIPKEVTGLTFNSSDFTIKVVGNELQPTEGVYTIKHDENATETTIPVRIRLNDGVDKETASFTFNGTSDDANVTVRGDTENITLNSNSDANVRWQGNVPLSNNDYAAIVPLKYEWFHDGNNFIPAGSKLNLEFNVTGDNTSWLEVFEICGITPETDWNNPVHQFAELNGSNIYTATENGNITLSLTLSEATFTTISQNYRNDFLGEAGDANKIALAIRGTGITLTKVSVIPQILVTAPGKTEGVSDASVNISYNNSSAIEEYTITVTVPDGVTQFNYTNNGFSNVYISNGNGWYNDASQSINTSETKSIPLKLRVNKNSSNPSITFSANGALDAKFTVNRTAGSTNSNVLWEGSLQLQGSGVDISKVEIPNNLLQGKLFDDAQLTLEYEVINDNNDYLTVYGSAINSWANLNNMAENGEYTENNTTATLKLNPTIIDNIGNGPINMQGDGRVLKKVTLTPTSFVYNFEDGVNGVKLDGWNNLETEIVYDEVLKSNVLKLTVKIENGYAFAQLGITGNYTGSYTLSLRYRIGTAEASDRTMNLVFQKGESEGYATSGEPYSYTNISTSENTFNQQITLSDNFEQFVIKFEKVQENDIFYIDDLKLVKNN